MKAEQRKELETNTLADKMGQAMHRVKSSPRRTFLTYLLLTAAAVIVLWLGWRWLEGNRVERSGKWLSFYDGSGNVIEALADDKESTPPNKAARFQAAWIRYWDEGVKKLATNKASALKNLERAGELYSQLADECKDDKVFLSQAMLGQAVVEESRAVEDRSRLDKAINYYQALVEKDEKDKAKYCEAEVNFAQKRLDILTDKTKRAVLSATYNELQAMFGIQSPLAPPRFEHGNIPGFGREK